MKRVIALVLLVTLLCISLTTAIAIEGDTEYCSVCNKTTIWNECCTGVVASRTAYTFHYLADGTVCNKHTEYVRNGIKCRTCGNQKVYTATHTHVIHDYCGTEKSCR